MLQRQAHPQTTKPDIVLITLLFAIWPLAGFITALLLFSSKSLKITYTILFFCVIGYYIRYENTTGDASRYAEQFRFICNSTFQNAIIRPEGKNDLFSVLSMYLIGKVSSTPSTLFVFWGALYGWIVSLCLFFVVDKLNNPRQFLPLFFLMYMQNPHCNINGIRFWFATWVYIYILLNLINKDSWKKEILMLVTYFIHNAMAIPVCIYYLYKFSKLNIRILQIILLISFIVSFFIDFSDILSNISLINTNESYYEYVDADNVQNWIEFKARRSSLNIFLTSLPFYIVLPILYYWGRILSNISDKQNEKYIFTINIYSVCMVFFSSLCFFRNVPGLGRFSVITYILFFITAMLLMDLRLLKRLKAWQWLFMILFIGLTCLNIIEMKNIMKIEYVLPFNYFMY